jgi:glycosyltransferase involved in cell wall biosynthesis
MNVTVDGIVYQLQSHGGISRIYDEILPRMCARDAALHVSLLTTGKCRKAVPTHPRIDHHALPPVDDLMRPRILWRSSRYTVRALTQHLLHQKGGAGIWHSTGFTLPHRWKGPVVLTVYDMVYEHYRRDFFAGSVFDDVRVHKQRCVARADAIISISASTRRDLQSHLQVDPARVRVIPLAASAVFRQLEEAPHADLPRPFLLYVGARYAYKNFDRLLGAYAGWPRGKEVDLVVVGGGWTRRERQLLEALHLTGRVHVQTGTSDEQLCRLYNRAAALVFPSCYEGFGIPLVEAMVCGCPIVASDIPTSVEVAGAVPIYFDPASSEALAAALDQALSEGRGSERVRRGLSRASEFSWDHNANQTLEIYRELAGRRPAGADLPAEAAR